MNHAKGLRVSCFTGLAMMMIPIAGLAQTREVSVSYLRAAASSLPDRATVSFDAIFVAEQGMIEPQAWNMKGRGLSRFTVKDPQSAVLFANMYCPQDSRAFKELIKLDSSRPIRITGYKADGENNQPSIYATAVEVLPLPEVRKGDDKAPAPKTLRITLKNANSGTRTILANVVPGKSYTVDDLTLTVETEPDLSAPAEKTGAGNP